MFLNPVHIVRRWYRAIISWGAVGAIVAAITLMAALLRFYHLGTLSLWGDEIDTMFFSSRNFIPMFQFLWPKEMNMSLFYVIMHFWQRLFSHPSDTTLRFIPALISVISIPAVFFLGKKISADRWTANATGIIAATLISINAFHIQYAQELRSYSLTFLLSTLSTLLLISAIQKPRSALLWIGYVATSVAGMYSHDFIAFLLIAQAASLLVLVVGNFRYFPYVGVASSFAAIALLSLPMVIAAHLAGTGGLDWVQRPTMASTLGFLFDVTGGGMLLLMLYIIAISIDFFIDQSWRQKDLVEQWIFVLLASCMIIPASIVLLISEIWTPIFVDRYFIMSLPFLAILAAFGIARLMSSDSMTQRFSGLALGMLIVFCSLSGLADFYTHDSKEDWRDTAAFLTAQCADADELRLYYPAWTKDLASYYAPSISTQNPLAEGDLYNPTSKAIDSLISPPVKYSKICIVMSQGSDISQLGTTPSVIKSFLPTMTTSTFPAIKVYIFSKPSTTNK